MLVNKRQNRILSLKLPSEGRSTFGHVLKVLEGEGQRVLLWGIIPCNVVEVMVYSSVLEFLAVADYGVEVTLWRRYKIGIVHEQYSRQIIPTHDRVLYERP